MSEELPVEKKSLLKSFLIALVVLVIIVAIIFGLGAAGLPGWPFVFFLFYFTTIAGMAKEKLWISAIGGLIGMTVGFLQGLVAAASGSETVGLVVFLACIIALVTLVVDGRVKVIEPLCMLMVTCLTGFTGVTSPETYLPALASYAIAVVLFALIVTLTSKSAKKAVSLEGAE